MVGLSSAAEAGGSRSGRATAEAERKMTSPPDFPCEGGCACGAVRYRLLEDPLELHVCHCTRCQTVSGSAFVMCMPVHVQSFELSKGAPKVVSFEPADGLAKRHARCPSCDCCIWGEIGGVPEVLALQAGTLDDTHWLEPIAHIWTRSAQPWVEIPASVLRYEEQPEDDLALIRAWKGRHAP